MGVELVPSDTAAVGTFGMAKLSANTEQSELCLSVNDNSSTLMCSTYSKYVNYSDAQSTTGKKYLYN